MKKYLFEFFTFNCDTNLKLLAKIRQAPEPAECVKFFSHLIQSQNKWMARIMQDPAAPAMSWWEPVLAKEDLEAAWKRSTAAWLEYLDSKTEEEIAAETVFTGHDGGQWAATPLDIALQLNYHSIHHRAQMQTLLRQQGVEPDFVDYIGTKYRKLS